MQKAQMCKGAEEKKDGKSFALFGAGGPGGNMNQLTMIKEKAGLILRSGRL